MSDPERLQNPRRRNCVWRIIQLPFQVFCLTWIRLRTRGAGHLPEQGALLLSNHQSFLDPLLIGVFLQRPVSYLARDSLFRVPVIGWILRNTYVMSIRREAAGTESLRKSIARLEQGFLVGLFPEGTRSSDGLVGEVKPGFVAMIRRAKVPIIPVGISGAYQAMPRNSRFIRPARIRVVYGEPISVDQIEKLCQKGREKEFISLVRQRLIECHQQAEDWRLGKKT